MTGTMWRLELLACSVLFIAGCKASTTIPPHVTTPQVCQDGFYGSSCTPCGHCKDNRPCDKVTGACLECEVGYDFTADSKCTTQCSPGRYGANCSGHCSDNCNPAGSCDFRTGSCTCKPGWHGTLCNTACSDGQFGQDCSGTCGQCAQDAVCDKVTGNCPAGCDPGYDPSDPTCRTECSSLYWGQDCVNRCSSHCQLTSGRPCDKVTGHCQCQPGYKVPLCAESCDEGAWGQDCNERCSAHCRVVCDKTNGQCTCEPGYQPPRCTAKCGSDKYGQDCSNDCGFCHKGICDHVTGNCSRCVDNRKMPLCKECFAGQWGPTCGQRCGQCGGDGECDPLSGVCLSSCLDGWTSSSCDDKCTNGTYGQGCSQQCGHCRNDSPCRHDNGICEQDCEDGYTGVLCQTEEESLVAPIVGGLLGAAALIAIAIVGAVCFMKRSPSKGPQTPRKDFTDLGGGESASDQPEAISMRDSRVYQNVETTVGSNNNYDRTNFARQDSHAYDVHSPGKVSAEQDPAHHTYQNTRGPDGRPSDADRKKRGIGGKPAEPEATYGNVGLPLQAPEATYGNL